MTMPYIENESDFATWNLAALSRALHDKDISPVEVIRHLLKRIEKINPEVNAFITLLAEEALSSAIQAEKEIMEGKIKSALHGIPIGLKDLIYTKGIKTTMGSEIYKDFIPEFDAAVVEQLKEAGAIIIGKLNTHQFAYGPTGDRSYFGPVKNPHDLTKITGGSSSGSGAAVATSLCYAALGTDTGGSIRIPSACCGVVGMKPTFGRVSKYGVYPLCWTLDHIGPLTRTVEDNALVLSVLAGFDSRDPYSLEKEKEDFTRFLAQGIKGSVIGVPMSFYLENIQNEVRRKFEEALEIFKGLGAQIREVDIPRMKEISWAQQVTIRSEAYTEHEEHLRNMADQIEEEVRERLLSGIHSSLTDYIRAQQLKHMAKQVFDETLQEVDVLVTPTLPILPTKLQQREVEINSTVETVRSALTRLTGPTDFNGFPSLSIPCGTSLSGLPIGLQIIGRRFDEANLYRFGNTFEKAR